MIALFILLIGLFRAYDRRLAVIYPEPSLVEVSSGAAGDKITIVAPITKLRGECHVAPAYTDTIIVDSEGNAFLVNQRSGVRKNLPVGKHKVAIDLEIPRFAAPGPAFLQFDTTYQCSVFSMRQSAPPYPFEILQ